MGRRRGNGAEDARIGRRIAPNLPHAAGTIIDNNAQALA
jgi:hypothetical protein